MDIDLELTQEDDAIGGTAAAGFSWQGFDFSFSGTAEGAVVEDEVSLTLDLADGGIIEIEATLVSSNRIEGACSGDGGISGGGWLEQ